MQETTNPTAEDEMPLLFDMERTRHELGNISERTVYNLVARGQLERVKVARSTKFTSKSVKKLATGRK